jgi:MOSC domain-containing protein YiiM
LVIDVISVNVGMPRLLARQHGMNVYSGIAKQAVPPGTVLWLSLGNLSGDAQADLSVHGGPDKAVYAYPSEHLAAWEADLGGPLGASPFGENLSTRGLTEEAACIGDQWRWDGAILEVCQPRWPCFKLALYRGRADIQARMRATGRTGWYLRVIEPGEVTVGSPIELVQRDGAGLSVAGAHRAMADRHLQDRDLVEAFAKHERLAAEWGDPLRERLGLT